MKKNLTLWQKIQFKYEYYWLDISYEFYEIAARPTWYYTHTQKQISRRLATFNAKLEKFRQEQEEVIRELMEYSKELKKEKLKTSQSEQNHSL